MSRNTLSIARGVGVIGVTISLMIGATFAALNSSATLTNSSLETTNASLLIWDGAAYSPTAPGFTITGLVPGTGVTQNAYFKNAGGTPIKISAHIPTLPSSHGFSGFNNLTVVIHSQREGLGCADTDVTTDMAALNAGDIVLPCSMQPGDTGDSGTPGTSGNYDFHFDINPASISGSSAGVGVFDMVFTGNQTL